MKTIGLIGGMSWESTQTYYQEINEGIKQALGGLHSAKLVLWSVDFAEIEACQAAGDWAKSAAILAEAAAGLAAAGADMLIICTNTMHKVAQEVQRAAGLPLIHIADAAAQRLLADGVHKTGLLGTRYTLTQGFYKDRLTAAGIEIVLPGEEDIALVNRVIYEELCLGRIEDSSRREYIRVIDDMRRRGAQAVILGCTEIGLLIGPKDSSLPVYDTTLIHAQAAVRAALQ